MASRVIPAYTRVTRDFLLVADRGLPNYMYLPPEMAKQLQVITRFDKIVGRVLDHDKAPGYPFTEKDFLPSGTREGIVAAIPAGKRAMTIEASKVEGIHSLRVGDHLDLLSSQSIDMGKVMGAHARNANSLHAGVLAQSKQAHVRVLVQNGLLVSPVRTRVVPITSSSLTQGATTRTKPIQEVVIAVDPEEIAPLAEALSIEALVTCVARSGLPDDPGPASVTPSGSSPADHVATVERIVGGAREVMFVTKGASLSSDPRSMITIPLCGKALQSGTTITPEHLLDPATNRPRIVSLRPGDARRMGLLADPTKIVGRVLSRKKSPDTGFTEADFEPQPAPAPASEAAPRAVVSRAGTPSTRVQPATIPRDR